MSCFLAKCMPVFLSLCLRQLTGLCINPGDGWKKQGGGNEETHRRAGAG